MTKSGLIQIIEIYYPPKERVIQFDNKELSGNLLRGFTISEAKIYNHIILKNIHGPYWREFKKQSYVGVHIDEISLDPKFFEDNIDGSIALMIKPLAKVPRIFNMRIMNPVFKSKTEALLAEWKTTANAYSTKTESSQNLTLITIESNFIKKTDYLEISIDTIGDKRAFSITGNIWVDRILYKIEASGNISTQGSNWIANIDNSHNPISVEWIRETGKPDRVKIKPTGRNDGSDSLTGQHEKVVENISNLLKKTKIRSKQTIKNLKTGSDKYN
ncbi:MAG: hypothetical protein VX112_05030 [Pseudomonadota bacterium]|nr:hypothetical protein [Pseudomonadota bacterium]